MPTETNGGNGANGDRGCLVIAGGLIFAMLVGLIMRDDDDYVAGPLETWTTPDGQPVSTQVLLHPDDPDADKWRRFNNGTGPPPDRYPQSR